MDLISRQAVIDMLAAMQGRCTSKAALIQNSKIWQQIKDLPSVQPEIIRCKDCKHFAGEGMYCSCDIIVQFDHFYCYHAERRTDG